MTENNKNPRTTPYDGRKATGKAGEEIAASYFEELGYRIVVRNWRCRFGELDIVAEDGDTVVIAEVRTRTGSERFGSAAESVTPQKQRKVRTLAQMYLSAEQKLESRLRFDVVAVLMVKDKVDVKHIPNAF
ncbi:YraN family protein [Paenibacillus gansuensis]|uniref:UPF0102 protein ACFSUF_11175 n=1 Tax=Paenibacillus gansuensis TaxID=306542 RepID=A0ABW5PCY1_9BACL